MYHHARCVGFCRKSDGHDTCNNNPSNPGKVEYFLPDGEWYCSQCTLANLVSPSKKNNNDYTYNNDGDNDDDNDNGIVVGSGDGSNGSDQRILHLQAEYHTMRRERNRILKQWQQEKQVVALVADKQRKLENKRESELSEVCCFDCIVCACLQARWV